MRAFEVRVSRTAANRILACVLAFLIPFYPAYAGMKEGYAAYMRADYEAAMKEFRPLAEHGDPAAQIAVGWLYDNAKGVAHDDATAAHWYTLAATQGCALPQQYLGLMFAQGEGVPKDLAKAQKWFRLAAEQGEAGGQYGLGVIYRDGAGLPPDPIEAYKWFTLAMGAGTGDFRAEEAIAARTELATQMTPQQIAKAEALAKEWKPSQPHGKPKAQRCSLGALK